MGARSSLEASRKPVHRLRDGATPLTDEFLTGLLSHLLPRYGGSQVLLFGAAGERFWAARELTKIELRLLENAPKLIESLDVDHPKPFVGHDARRRLLVAALDAVEYLRRSMNRAPLRGLAEQ